jgi:hypothetical protein
MVPVNAAAAVKLPATHEEQSPASSWRVADVAGSDKYFPVGQEVQELADALVASVVEYVPAGQTVHDEKGETE